MEGALFDRRSIDSLTKGVSSLHNYGLNFNLNIAWTILFTKPRMIPECLFMYRQSSIGLMHERGLTDV